MQILYYFAYGSNMNTERVAERGLHTGTVQGGVLPDYRLTFNKSSRDHPGYGHADIEYAPTERVEGVLYELVDEQQILKMDPFERAPWNYGRDVVRVHTSSGPIWAWTYFANSAVKRPGLTPPEAYLKHLLAGREWLSEAYFQHLLQWREGAAEQQ
ncbi:MAG: gamma-glutamylcyclotransferase family protein [Pseudomonadota bacterium]